MERLSVKETAAEIRKLLKAKGWGAKEISVRSETFSMGSAVRVEIKTPLISKKVVEEIANRFSSIRYCESSGEVLGGGNRYITTEYTWEVMQALYPAVATEVEAMLVGLTKVIHGIQIHRVAEKCFELIRLQSAKVEGARLREAFSPLETAHIVVHEAAHHGMLKAA